MLADLADAALRQSQNRCDIDTFARGSRGRGRLRAGHHQVPGGQVLQAAAQDRSELLLPAAQCQRQSHAQKRYPAAEDALGSTTAKNDRRIKLGVSCPNDIEVKTSVEQRKIKVVTERNQENTW